jgi:hypothetical protein
MNELSWTSGCTTPPPSTQSLEQIATQQKCFSNTTGLKQKVSRTQCASNKVSLEQKNLEHIFLEHIVPGTGALEHMSVFPAAPVRPSRRGRKRR